MVTPPRAAPLALLASPSMESLRAAWPAAERPLAAALSSLRAGDHGRAMLERSDIERVVRDHSTSDAAARARALLASRSATSRAR